MSGSNVSSSFNISALLCLTIIASATSLILPINSISSIGNIIASNTTTNLSDIALSLSNTPNPICTGEYFGHLIRPASCLEVIKKLSRGTKRLSFGPKSRRVFDVQLPRRLSSSDGTCVIEISHKEGTDGDIAGEDEIRRAALNIAESCVFKPMHEGGLVRNLGQFGTLLVAIRRYDPSVTCFGTARRLRSVGQDLLDNIPTTTAPQLFGPEGGPGVDVAVPTVITRDLWTLPPYGWQANIDTLDRMGVVGRWFDLWSGAVAIDAMCVERQGRPGQALLQGGLRITLGQAREGVVGNLTLLER